MCPPTMYISSGLVVPTLVQNTSSRGVVPTGGASPTCPCSAAPRGILRVVVANAFNVRAPVALQLRLDPVDGAAIPLRALPAVPKLGESLDGRLVLLEIESGDHVADGICRVSRSGVALRQRRCAQDGQRDEH